MAIPIVQTVTPLSNVVPAAHPAKTPLAVKAKPAVKVKPKTKTIRPAVPHVPADPIQALVDKMLGGPAAPGINAQAQANIQQMKDLNSYYQQQNAALSNRLTGQTQAIQGEGSPTSATLTAHYDPTLGGNGNQVAADAAARYNGLQQAQHNGLSDLTKTFAVNGVGGLTQSADAGNAQLKQYATQTNRKAAADIQEAQADRLKQYAALYPQLATLQLQQDVATHKGWVDKQNIGIKKASLKETAAQHAVTNAQADTRISQADRRLELEARGQKITQQNADRLAAQTQAGLDGATQKRIADVYKNLGFGKDTYSSTKETEGPRGKTKKTERKSVDKYPSNPWETAFTHLTQEGGLSADQAATIASTWTAPLRDRKGKPVVFKSGNQSVTMTYLSRPQLGLSGAAVGQIMELYYPGWRKTHPGPY